MVLIALFPNDSGYLGRYAFDLYAGYLCHQCYLPTVAETQKCSQPVGCTADDPGVISTHVD